MAKEFFKINPQHYAKHFVLALGLMSFTGNSFASDRSFYLKFAIGKIFAQKFNDTPDAGYIENNLGNYALYAGSVGYKFDSKFSASLGLQFRCFKYNAAFESQRITQRIYNYLALLNGYYNFITAGIFTSYISAGIGYTYNKPSDLVSDDPVMPEVNFIAPKQNAKAFVWNAGLGAKVNFSKNVDLDITYRYINLGKVKVRSTLNELDRTLNSASQNLKGHQVTLGIIYNL